VNYITKTEYCVILQHVNRAYFVYGINPLKFLRMKKIRTLVTILFLSFIVFGMTSCLVTSRAHHDNGKHKGWFKKSNKHNKKGTAIFIVAPHNKDFKSKNKNKKHKKH
jgi:hypothetical protein